MPCFLKLHHPQSATYCMHQAPRFTALKQFFRGTLATLLLREGLLKWQCKSQESLYSFLSWALAHEKETVSGAWLIPRSLRGTTTAKDTSLQARISMVSASKVKKKRGIREICELPDFVAAICFHIEIHRSSRCGGTHTIQPNCTSCRGMSPQATTFSYLITPQRVSCNVHVRDHVPVDMLTLLTV